jgi:DNA-binding NarL/FixJ family response regulator
VTSPPTRVLVVEDNAVYRATLELLLPTQPGIEVIGAVGDGDAAVAASRELRPDVVLLDLRLPGLAGAEAVVAVLATAPGTCVVCLTAEATPELRDEVIAAGAAAVLDKALPTHELADALRSAAHA